MACSSAPPGPHRNVLKVRPPLAFTEREVPVFVEALQATLRTSVPLDTLSLSSSPTKFGGSGAPATWSSAACRVVTS